MRTTTTRHPRRIRLLGAAAAAAIATAGVAAGAAAVETPTEPQPYAVSYSNFESSQPDMPWAPRGEGVTTTTTNEVRRSPWNSLYVTGRTQAWHGVEISIGDFMEAGQSYDVTAWVRLPDGAASTRAKLTAAQSDGQYIEITPLTAVNSDEWVELTGSYSPPEGVDGTIYIELEDPTASFYVDDAAITAFACGRGPVDDSTSLLDALPYPVGAAVTANTVQGDSLELLNQHFNQVTPENFMKPEAWYNDDHSFVTENAEADAVMDWAQAGGGRVYGHVLVWHSQTPDWLFQHEDGTFLSGDSEADRQELRERMRTHINNVAKYLSDKYGLFGSDTNPLVAFDVVNEVITDGPSPETDGLRNSYWYQILGEEFIDDAFIYANEAFNSTYAAPGADHPVTLFINEYNTQYGTDASSKTGRYHALIERLVDRGVPIDGVGHQFHAWLDDDVEGFGAAMSAFDDLPLVQAVTELDVPTRTGTPVDTQTLLDQGRFYQRLFEMFAEQDAKRDLFSVTLWGLVDSGSWRFYEGDPLLFDPYYHGKWGYAAAVGQEIPATPQECSVPEPTQEPTPTAGPSATAAEPAASAAPSTSGLPAPSGAASATPVVGAAPSPGGGGSPLARTGAEMLVLPVAALLLGAGTLLLRARRRIG
ncbi:endo-1,4-beta-xylanase [Actinomyces ruminicola]|uniref:Beta-xylanase n=1 Tax=Actinomyces ruminicola TaxID=332524 RepID=A0A1H0AFW2_9ACTO|nr:endo-1,4-beta-xylanase [Actinomyces ruminicola]SDN31676.1 Endo-1,4-beta-xylanase, GH35 family [Actinomyces ruminicola]